MKKLLNEMPILKEFHESTELDLSNTLLITGHHILESNKLLLECFVERGLLPSNVYALGKCYSTNNEVAEEYKKSGFNIHNLSNSFTKDLTFGEQYSKNIELFIDYIFNQIETSNFYKVIVWDDGGKILEHIKSLKIDTSNFYGIEHTSNGYNRLKTNKKLFPVVNVARSDVKLKIESHFVAELSYNNLKKLLYGKIKKNLKVLIVGGGYIGQSLRVLINNDFRSVTVVDKNKDNSDIDNYNLIELINNNDIILGCTGENIINFTDFSKLNKGKYFASLSSGDYEFPAYDIRKQNFQNGIWDNLEYNGNTILNGGFPITFKGLRKAIPSEQIQVTRTLIYGAVKQIMELKIKNKEFIELDTGVQEFIKKSS